MKQRRRNLQVAAGFAAPPQEVRFSTRRAGKVANYNEDDDDPFAEADDSELMTPAYAEGDEAVMDTVDVVLQHRLKEEYSKLCNVPICSTHSN